MQIQDIEVIFFISSCIIFQLKTVSSITNLIFSNPYKAPIVLLREVYCFFCCCQTYTLSLDFPILVQSLGKFQTHCWLRISRMHSNVCFLMKLQLVKEL